MKTYTLLFTREHSALLRTAPACSYSQAEAPPRLVLSSSVCGYYKNQIIFTSIEWISYLNLFQHFPSLVSIPLGALAARIATWNICNPCYSSSEWRTGSQVPVTQWGQHHGRGSSRRLANTRGTAQWLGHRPPSREPPLQLWWGGGRELGLPGTRRTHLSGGRS